jgi:hypothetical protein
LGLGWSEKDNPAIDSFDCITVRFIIYEPLNVERAELRRSSLGLESRVKHIYDLIEKKQGNMSTIRFEAKLFRIGSWTLLRLPKSASAKLPSRGMTMVEGTINGFRFQAALEPDGKGSHWFRFNKTMREGTGADAGDTVTLAIEPTKEWPEPEVPADLKNALAAAPQAHALWLDTTPNAHWDWIRCIGSTKQPETRRRRIEVACSKLKAGERRPCCFNRNLCCEPYVSSNGVLLEPTQTTAAKAK